MIITFNPYRTIGIQNIQYIKPENMFQYRKEIEKAKLILFPEYWQVPTLVFGFKKKIFPSLESYLLGHNKVEMTRAFWSVCPDNVPYTEILANTEYNRKKVLEEWPFPFIAKEIKNSMGKGVILVKQENDFWEYARKNEVLYIQEYLPIQKDLRIVYVGNKVITGYWRIAQEGNYLNNVSQGGTISYEEIPLEAIKLVESIATKLGINHAGFDVAMVDNKPYLLEFNVQFGNRGIGQGLVEKTIQEYIENIILKDNIFTQNVKTMV